MQYGFVIDQRKCIGCHACTVACKSENEVPVGNFRTWVKYTEIGSFPTVKRHFAVLRCNQCTNAPCITICPVTALSKRDDGIVDLDKDACVGCKACIQACPYDAIYLNEDTGGAEKCHYCAHRVEQNLKPACEVVCPEEAIISGDISDPNSKVGQLARMPEAQVRREEQGTGPNVSYLGIDPVSLKPGHAAEPETYLWSERQIPPPDYPPEFATYPEARTVLDVNHPVRWGWKVSLYLVTKGIGAGAGMLAPFLAMLGGLGFASDYLPEIIGLSFTAITVLILIMDLGRPMTFIRLLTRPNTRSWLVKGGWVLSAFCILSTGILAARFFGESGLADILRWVNLPVAFLTAAYTAFLFAQCEGRDLWQDAKVTVPHLTAQALMIGALCLAPFQDGESLVGSRLALLALATAAIHLILAMHEKLRDHETDNARQAASLLGRIPAWKGSEWRAFPLGLSLSSAACMTLVLADLVDIQAQLFIPTLAFALIGLFLYEQSYLRAGQLPPLS